MEGPGEGSFSRDTSLYSPNQKTLDINDNIR
jgi:hypothetical protein